MGVSSVGSTRVPSWDGGGNNLSDYDLGKADSQKGLRLLCSMGPDLGLTYDRLRTTYLDV